MGTLVVLALFGSRHQDRKLLALRGESFAEYLSRTSTVPFAAALAGRTRIVWRELPKGALALGVVLAFALRAVHAHLFEHAGVYVIAPVVLGAFSILAAEWRSELRQATRAAGAAHT
jgi:uncharacterized membrane protein